MKKYLFLFSLLTPGVLAQTKAVPCTDSADLAPGRYTDHTNPKYPSSLKGKELAAMRKVLIAIEKIEEESRKDFDLRGCEARVSFSNYTPNPNTTALAYGYQLGVYPYVCHVTEKIVKTVGEYRTVFRVSVNASLPGEGILTNQTGEFFLDKPIHYAIPMDVHHDAKVRAVHYFSERSFINGRSDDYKNLNAEFSKLNRGEGYVESYLHGKRDEPLRPDGYQWVSRIYPVLPEGKTFLVPLSRKQYLEDLLDYFEHEKIEFQKSWQNHWNNNVGDQSESGLKRKASLESDKAKYPRWYEAKKAKVKELLSTQTPEWLSKQAVVDQNINSYDAKKRLETLANFYEKETEKTHALYVRNPALLLHAAGAKPLYFEVQFRYEKSKDRGHSERLFANFQKNYRWEALRKML